MSFGARADRATNVSRVFPDSGREAAGLRIMTSGRALLPSPAASRLSSPGGRGASLPPRGRWPRKRPDEGFWPRSDAAPGIATAAENLVHENAAPEEECAFARREPEEDVSSLDAPPNDRQNPPAWSMLWDARLRVVSQHGARQSRPAAPAGDDRPGIRPQTPEKIKSAPGDGWPAEAAPAPDDSTPMILTPTGWRRQNVRMALNGVAAC